MKDIIDNIKLGFSMILIGAILLYIGSTVFMPELTIKIFRFQPYIVVTESMEPVINVNDVVVVTTFKIDEAEVGDIITFMADIDYNGTKEVITHYIYEIDRSDEEEIIRTHRHFDEDETVTPDTWLISESDIIGSYAFQIPKLGFLLGFLKSIYGIVIIAVNIILFALIKYFSSRKKTKEEISD